ncbi:DnaB-like helicase N-terminal domain-containing protein [Paenarthrobacter sp. NPDC089316]|uniref:replicative DNA helicase n=1 Tax=unclassified Paenarthrobacter TaxID=2634190 RepID=UPI00343E80C2
MAEQSDSRDLNSICLDEGISPVNDIHDNAAEQSVLGAMLLSREAILDVAELVSGGDFYRPEHETIFRTILATHAAGKPVDPVTVGDALTTSGEIAQIGGQAYLHTITQAVPTPATATYYADIVARSATRRRLIAAGKQISTMASAGGDEAELVEIARRAIDQTTKATTGTVQSFGETIDLMIDSLDEDINHHPSPWAALNDIIGGFRPRGGLRGGCPPLCGKVGRGAADCKGAHTLRLRSVQLLGDVQERRPDSGGRL